MRKVVIFSGAGVSAESGISTFRQKDGLWEKHNIEDVCHPRGWRKDPEFVLNFYNTMRRTSHAARPNKAHEIIAEMEKEFHVVVVTQNIDDLHKQAGSTKIIHLHGELMAARSTSTGEVLPWSDDITLQDHAPDGSKLRPHIVWFEEMPYGVEEAQKEIMECDILIVVGTSLMIGYTVPLLGSASSSAEVYYVDPHPSHHLRSILPQVEYIRSPATMGMQEVVKKLVNG